MSADAGERSGAVTSDTRTDRSMAAEIVVSKLNAFDRSSSALPAATPPRTSTVVTDTDVKAIRVVEGATFLVTRNGADSVP
jgi:hypothetical protein